MRATGHNRLTMYVHTTHQLTIVESGLFPSQLRLSMKSDVWIFKPICSRCKCFWDSRTNLLLMIRNHSIDCRDVLPSHTCIFQIWPVRLSLHRMSRRVFASPSRGWWGPQATLAFGLNDQQELNVSIWSCQSGPQKMICDGFTDLFSSATSLKHSLG